MLCFPPPVCFPVQINPHELYAVKYRPGSLHSESRQIIVEVFLLFSALIFST